MSHNLPVVGISGKARSGKDAVAQHLVTRHGYTQLAWADTVKRMSSDIFLFTEDQLWGPSDNRNEVDHRFSSAEVWEESRTRLGSCGKGWIAELMGIPESTKRVFEVFLTLVEWFDRLRESTPSLSPRIALQTLGTDWARLNIHTDVWVDYTMNMARQVLSYEPYYIYSRTQGLQEVDKDPDIRGVVISDIRFENELRAILDFGGYLIRLLRPDPHNQEAILHHISESIQDGFDPELFNAAITNDGTLKDLYQDLDVVLHAVA